TIIGMGGHKRQQQRQQQEQPSLSLREVNIPPATADSAIVTLHARRGCVNTSCSLQRPERCLTPSTKCIDAGRASAAREDHSDVRVTESQHVRCDVVAWHLHTHTHAAPASLPFASVLCRSGHTHGQQQNHFTLDDPKSTPTALATQKDLSCQHGPPAALPSTLKHGTVHALIFLVCSQPFASHILQWADVHKSTQQKATVIAHALA
ncbi:hypothetical protein TCSYLVIO_000678, partial [Trypanosoma cruzi]